MKRFSSRTILSPMFFIAAAAVAAFMVSCGGSSSNEPKLSLKTEDTVEVTIEAARGGWIRMKDGSAAVHFPADSLERDATITLTPIAAAPGSVDEVINPGFQLQEKDTGRGPALSQPATVTFMIASENEEAVIFKYTADGYEPEAASMITTGLDGAGKTFLTTEVSSFSNFGTKKPNEKDKAAKAYPPAKKKPEEMADTYPIIYVDSNSPYPWNMVDVMTWDFHLTMTAICQDCSIGNLTGTYSGDFSIKGTGTGQLTGTCDDKGFANFSLTEVNPAVVPLTESGNTIVDIDEKTINEKQLRDGDYYGTGKLSFNSGSCVVTGAGGSASEGIKWGDLPLTVIYKKDGGTLIVLVGFLADSDFGQFTGSIPSIDPVYHKPTDKKKTP